MFKTLLVAHKNPSGIDLFADGGRCEPLPLTYLAAYLRSRQKEVEILDANLLGLSHDQVAAYINKHRFDLIGLSATTPDFYEIVKLAKKIKKIKNPPYIVIGGAHISAIPKDIQKYLYFDFAVIGEGEETLLELVTSLENKNNKFNDILGLVFKKGKKLIVNQIRPYIKNLDILPFPARDLLPPLSKYHPTPGMYKKLSMAFMITSRGCPFQCLFCSHSVFGHHYRFRSPKNVVDEMEILVRDFNVAEIRICDDLFNFNEERVLAICREIVRRKIKVSWGCSVRANLVSRKQLIAFKKAGCWEINFGVESADPKILETIKKGVTTEDVRRAVKLAKEVGLETRGFFILGLPGDTPKTIQATINLAKNLKLPMAQFYMAVPYPGTELAKRAREFGSVNTESFENYLSQTTKKPPFIPFGLTAKQLNSYLNKAYREYYLRPSFLLNRLLKIRSWTQIKASAQGLVSISRQAF